MPIDDHLNVTPGHGKRINHIVAENTSQETFNTRLYKNDHI